jgi:hypothetical protein
MSKLHKSSYNDVSAFENNEGQRGLLCSNKTSLRCPSLSSKAVLSDSSLKALEELASVLKPIYLRMKKEGYGMVNGRLVKIKENE